MTTTAVVETEQKIKITREYEKFKKLDGNRPLDEAHVQRLMASMRKQVLFDPISVNSELCVVDGQHRLEARKRLNLPIPYFIVGDYGLQEVQTLNAQQKKWSINDFTKSFIELGSKDYVTYQWFRSKYELPHQESLLLLMGMTEQPRNLATIFQLGGFKVKDLMGAKAKAEMIRQVEPFFDKFKHRSFVQAILWLLNNRPNCFKFDVFIKRLEAQPTALKPCTNRDQYIDLIEQIYNHGSKNKVSLRYGD